jgi:hypothetical protein
MSIPTPTTSANDQARDLLKLSAAVSAANEESNPLWWALDFFDDPDTLMRVGGDTCPRSTTSTRESCRSLPD